MQPAPGTSTKTPPVVTGSDLRWIVTGLLSLGMMIAYMHRANLSVALADPDFKALFRLTDTDRGLLNSAFFWLYALLQVPAGWVVDRYGVKFPYAISFLFWSLVSASMAFSTSVGQLFVLLLLLGVGESVVAPASLRWIRFHFPETQRGLAVGIYMTGTKLGPAFGAPLSAFLLVSYGWRPMFMILGLGCLCWLVPWMLLVKNDDRQLAKQSVGADTSPSIPFGRVMASPVIWGTIVGAFCYMYFVYFCMTWMPAYFVERRNLSLQSMGFYQLFSFGGMAAMTVLSGWVADRMIARGRNPVTVRKASILAGFLIASTELIGAHSSSVPVALFFAIVSLSGLGLVTANYWALTQTLMPGRVIGRIMGVQNCAANLPGIVAPLLTGWLKQATGSYEAPMQAIGFFLILGIAAYVFLVREKYAPRAA